LTFFKGKVSVALSVLKTPTGGRANPKALAFFLPFDRGGNSVFACRAWVK
jgi:hypothetical protein